MQPFIGERFRSKQTINRENKTTNTLYQSAKSNLDDLFSNAPLRTKTRLIASLYELIETHNVTPETDSEE